MESEGHSCIIQNIDFIPPDKEIESLSGRTVFKDPELMNSGSEV